MLFIPTPLNKTEPIEMERSVSHDSYFRTPKKDKTDRRLYEYERGLPDACLFVASLSSQKSKKQLQKACLEIFQKFGPVLNVTVNRDNRNRPFAFVQFKYIRDAERASQESITIDDRLVRMERAKVNRSLHISKIQQGLSQKTVNEMASTVGQVEELSYNPTKNEAFIKFTYREDALKACSWYKQFGWNSQWMNQPFISVTVHGLLTSIKQDFIQELKRYGQVDHISFIERDENLTCYVRYKTRSSAWNVLRLHGTDFKGCLLNCVLRDP
jgi:hypothetical protein